MHEKFIARFERLNKETKWYHPIDFGDGYITDVDGAEDIYRGLEKWEFLKENLPDLNGRRIIDLGCSSGLYSLQAVRDGASFVLGLDRDPDAIRQAMFVRDVFSDDDKRNYIRYTDFQIYDVTKGISKFGRFDIAFMFSFIYLLGKDGARQVLRELRHLVDVVVLQARYYDKEKPKYPITPREISEELVRAGFYNSTMYSTVYPNKTLYPKPLIVAR